MPNQDMPPKQPPMGQEPRIPEDVAHDIETAFDFRDGLEQRLRENGTVINVVGPDGIVRDETGKLAGSAAQSYVDAMHRIERISRLPKFLRRIL